MQAISTYLAQNGHSDLQAAYDALIAEGLISSDPAQAKTVKAFLALNHMLAAAQNTSWFKKLFTGKPEKTKQGLYIYGEVGRGKSMLMDLYFSTTTVEKKRRVHFHAFMQEVHQKLRAWRHQTRDDASQKDPIVPLAQSIAKEADLFCFDEFQVTDIADAMILGRLFTELFNLGIVIVATSNRHPNDLYKDGLQRESFLPFIALLKKRVNVIELASPKDYRLEHLKSLKTTYFTPLGNEADNFLEKTFHELTHGAPCSPYDLPILGRVIPIKKTCGDVAAFSFKELCESPLGAADYIEVAREFGTIILSDIPELTPEKRNEAKRFVTLIDELYEHKVKLICTASVAPQALYTKGHGSFEFERTVSRLIEMQSESYLAAAHLA